MLFTGPGQPVQRKTVPSVLNAWATAWHATSVRTFKTQAKFFSIRTSCFQFCHRKQTCCGLPVTSRTRRPHVACEQTLSRRFLLEILFLFRYLYPQLNLRCKRSFDRAKFRVVGFAVTLKWPQNKQRCAAQTHEFSNWSQLPFVHGISRASNIGVLPKTKVGLTFWALLFFC